MNHYQKCYLDSGHHVCAVALLDKAERERDGARADLAKSVAHANEGWNREVPAEATIACVEALVEQWRGDGDLQRRTIFASVCIDELEAVLQTRRPDGSPEVLKE